MLLGESEIFLMTVVIPDEIETTRKTLSKSAFPCLEKRVIRDFEDTYLYEEESEIVNLYRELDRHASVVALGPINASVFRSQVKPLKNGLVTYRARSRNMTGSRASNPARSACGRIPWMTESTHLGARPVPTHN